MVFLNADRGWKMVFLTKCLLQAGVGSRITEGRRALRVSGPTALRLQ